MRLRVVHVHVPGLGRRINLVVELVRPGSDNLLQVVVTEFSVIKGVVASIDGVHLVRRSPLDHDRAGRLISWIILPDGAVSAVGKAGLECSYVVYFRLP